MHPRDLLQTPGTEPTPLASREAHTTAGQQAALVIEEVEVLRLTGPRETLRGVHRQPQVQPSHLYPDRRPPAYRDAADAKPETLSLTQYYVRIRTRGGLEGLYGAVDREALTTNGWVVLRDRPGFGIELDSAKIERQEVLTSI